MILGPAGINLISAFCFPDSETSMAVAIEYQPGEQPRINVQTRQNPPQTFLNKR